MLLFCFKIKRVRTCSIIWFHCLGGVVKIFLHSLERYPSQDYFLETPLQDERKPITNWTRYRMDHAKSQGG